MMKFLALGVSLIAIMAIEVSAMDAPLRKRIGGAIVDSIKDKGYRSQCYILRLGLNETELDSFYELSRSHASARQDGDTARIDKIIEDFCAIPGVAQKFSKNSCVDIAKTVLFSCNNLLAREEADSHNDEK